MKNILPLLQHKPTPPRIDEGEPQSRTELNFALWILLNIGATQPTTLARWLEEEKDEIASEEDRLDILYRRVRDWVLDDLGIITKQNGYVFLDSDIIEEVNTMVRKTNTEDDLGLNEDAPKTRRTRKPSTSPKKQTRANRRASPVKKVKSVPKAKAKPAPQTNSDGRGRPATNRLIRATTTVRELDLNEETAKFQLITAFGTGKRGKRENDVFENIIDTWEPKKTLAYNKNPRTYLRDHLRACIREGWAEVLSD